MTQQQAPAGDQRVTKQGILEQHRDEVIASLANNEPWSVIIPRYGVSKQSFARFVKKHQQEIDALKAEASQRIKDIALREKEARLRNYDRMIRRIDALIEERGGLEAVDVKWVGTGKVGREVEVRKFDAALVAEWRQLHDQIARELGDIPRSPEAPGVTVAVQVNLAWDDGEPA